MNRDLVWLVVVLILGGSILALLNSEEDNPQGLESLTKPKSIHWVGLKLKLTQP